MKLSHPLRGNPRVSGKFGWRGAFQLPDGRWTDPMHWGTDWAVPQGTPIYAAHDGVVRTNGWDSSYYGGGWWIQIVNGAYSTWYLHMQSRSPVPVGTRVKRGQLIGYVGSTGASTGPHLHLELHFNGTPVDPEDYFSPPKPKKPEERKDPVPVHVRSKTRPKNGLVVKKGMWTTLPIRNNGDASILLGGTRKRHGTFYCNIDVSGEADVRAVVDTLTTDGKRVTRRSPTYYQRINTLGTYVMALDLPAGRQNRIRFQARGVGKDVKINQIGAVAQYWDV